MRFQRAIRAFTTHRGGVQPSSQEPIIRCHIGNSRSQTRYSEPNFDTRSWNQKHSGLARASSHRRSTALGAPPFDPAPPSAAAAPAIPLRPLRPPKPPTPPRRPPRPFAARAGARHLSARRPVPRRARAPAAGTCREERERG